MHGGGEVVAERLRRVLNHLAGVRGADAGYDDDYTDDGPPVPADYPGLFSDDVSCGLCDVTLAYGDCLVLFSKKNFHLFTSHFQLEREMAIVSVAGVSGLIFVKTFSWCLRTVEVLYLTLF